jgi:hypothetical protein
VDQQTLYKRIVEICPVCKHDIKSGQPRVFVLLPNYQKSGTPAYIHRTCRNEEIERISKLVVMEFNEEELPVFSQGLKSHELLSVVDAKRCTDMLEQIVNLRQQLLDISLAYIELQMQFGRFADDIAMSDGTWHTDSETAGEAAKKCRIIYCMKTNQMDHIPEDQR